MFLTVDLLAWVNSRIGINENNFVYLINCSSGENYLRNFVSYRNGIPLTYWNYSNFDFILVHFNLLTLGKLDRNVGPKLVNKGQKLA